MRRAVLLFSIVIALPMPVLAAQVYRCTNADGAVEYRDSPCAGQPGGRITVEPNVTREIDQSAARAASKVIADRLAARAQAEDQAARARAQRRADGGQMQDGGIPWWQQPGPPPDREKKKVDDPPSTKPPKVKAPPIAPTVQPVPHGAIPVQLAPPR